LRSAQAHALPQRHAGPHAQADCAAVFWQPQLQLVPGQGLQPQGRVVVSFMSFSRSELRSKCELNLLRAWGRALNERAIRNVQQ
jgi:hypothetical protein